MIRLNLPKQPYWLELPLGVRLQVRPLTTAVNVAAQAHARAQVAGVVDDLKRRREVGVDVADLPDLADDAAREGYFVATYARALARSAILAWEGVLAADGEGPAPVTEQTVMDLMEIAPLAEAFLNRYQEGLDRLVSEGNGCGPAPSGTSAAGPSTAEAASSSAAAAPAASA